MVIDLIKLVLEVAVTKNVRIYVKTRRTLTKLVAVVVKDLYVALTADPVETIRIDLAALINLPVLTMLLAEIITTMLKAFDRV